MSRIFAISDIHVDYAANMNRVLGLSSFDFVDDLLIVAGDVSDSLTRLERVFSALKSKFAEVVFVPGNHELWIRNDEFPSSIEKFFAVLECCDNQGIHYKPVQFGSKNGVWIVPLFSWYRSDPDDLNTLFMAKEGEDNRRFRWGDDRFCRWPEEIRPPADWFSERNRKTVCRIYENPVLSVSHVLPRRELLFHDVDFARRFSDGTGMLPLHPKDPHPYFNFSRVAGCGMLERDIRRLGSRMHVYGHQHRNRNRLIAGIQYVSHCLGNLKEQARKPKTDLEPLCIWNQGTWLEWDDRIDR